MFRLFTGLFKPAIRVGVVRAFARPGTWFSRSFIRSPIRLVKFINLTELRKRGQIRNKGCEVLGWSWRIVYLIRVRKMSTNNRDPNSGGRQALPFGSPLSDICRINFVGVLIWPVGKNEMSNFWYFYSSERKRGKNATVNRTASRQGG